MWACTQLARGTHLVYILNLASIHIYHTSLSLPPLPPWILLPLLPSYDPSQSFGSAYVHCASIDTSNRASEHACRCCWPDADGCARQNPCMRWALCMSGSAGPRRHMSIVHARMPPPREGAVVLEGWGCMRAKLKASIVTRPRRHSICPGLSIVFSFRATSFDLIYRKYV
jgi:hypothetical protein